MQRIAVVGSTGSGKSTTAAALAVRLGYVHVELDSLHWGPNWTPRPMSDFRRSVAQAVAPDCWVVDGNYSAVRDLVWPRADTIVWIDLPLPVILYRLLFRTVRRILTQQDLWNGNRERWRHQFSRDSLFLWALTQYRRRRVEYGDTFAGSEWPHLSVIRLRNTAQINSWLRDSGSARSS